MKPMNESLSLALRKVIGGRLKQSNLGEVWHDQRTWRELGDQIIMALSGSVVLVDRETHERLLEDARQMRIVRARIEEYKSMLPEDQKKNGQRHQNAYLKWAAENLK